MIFDYWYFESRLKPVDKYLRQYIASTYSAGGRLAIENFFTQFGQYSNGEWSRSPKIFKELLLPVDRLLIIRLMEERGYRAIDREDW
jgi:hypothetical protein